MPLYADLLAISTRDGGGGPDPALAPFGPGTRRRSTDDVTLHWTDGPACGADDVFALSRVAPTREELVGHRALDRVPPFAAAALDGSALVGATDPAGLRHLYQRSGPGWVAVSTSALALAGLAPVDLDEAAIGGYALIGHYLADATPFRQIRLLPAGHRFRLERGALRLTRYASEQPQPAAEPGARAPVEPDAGPVADPVAAVAGHLRDRLTRWLQEYPRTVLELSGGLDSRLLLAAIPPERRAEVTALTLDAPGGHDLPVARGLAARYRMNHAIVDLRGLTELSPPEAHRLVRGEAVRHGAMGNPVAQGVLAWAEARTPDGARINGQGGEYTRGFYYAGQRDQPAVTPALVDRLARWRLFTNDRVAGDCLEPGFARDTDAGTRARLNTLLTGYRTGWLAATDEFYLRERLRRWFGCGASVAGVSRIMLSPYFDARVLSTGRRVPPGEKRGSRFNARVLRRLDPELARMPLDGGPRPSTVATVPALTELRQFGGKAAKKAWQRLHRADRSPVGAAVLADRLVEFWRSEPSELERVAATGLVRREWLDGLVAGRTGCSPATAGLLINLAVADAPTPSATPPQFNR